MENYPIDPSVIRAYFDPAIFIVKLTPLNPTHAARESGLTTMIDTGDVSPVAPLVEKLTQYGFESIVSIGEAGGKPNRKQLRTVHHGQRAACGGDGIVFNTRFCTMVACKHSMPSEPDDP